MQVSDAMLDLLGDVAKGDSDAKDSKSEKQVDLSTVAAQQWKAYKHDFKRPAATQDPLEWWRANRQHYSCFIPLVRRYFSIQVTSSSVERVFSTGGNIVSKKRSSLSPVAMEDLVLMHDNRDMLAHHLKLS